MSDALAFPLAGGRGVFLVSPEDRPIAESRKRWFLGNHGYVVGNFGNSSKCIHSLIMSPGPGQCVDHINRNKLDNRRENLRIASRLENSWNRPGWLSRKKSSRFKGVHFYKRVGRWTAAIRVAGKRVHLGTFATEAEAAAAYNDAATRTQGAFAYLNTLLITP